MRSVWRMLLTVWAATTGLASILDFALAWFVTLAASREGFVAWLSSPMTWLFGLPLWALVALRCVPVGGLHCVALECPSVTRADNRPSNSIEHHFGVRCDHGWARSGGQGF